MLRKKRKAGNIVALIQISDTSLIQSLKEQLFCLISVLAGENIQCKIRSVSRYWLLKRITIGELNAQLA
jgi:hypothetical protein